MRPTAGAGPGDDVDAAVTVDVARGYVHASGEERIVRGETRQDAVVKHRVVGREEAEAADRGPAEHLHVRPAAGARPGHDVSAAVAVDVARGYVHASGEERIVREENRQDAVVKQQVVG